MSIQTEPVRSPDARYYTDPTISAVEKAGLLAWAWRFVGHSSQL